MGEKRAYSHLRQLPLLAVVTLLAALAFAVPAYAAEGGWFAANGVDLQAQEGETSVTYDYDATRWNADYPGVYKTAPIELNKADSQDQAKTIGISMINKYTLADKPTTESPAIICGSAVKWYEPNGTKEEIEAAGKENARKFTNVSSGRIAPYSYFRFGVMSQTDAQGVTRPKLSGFDSTYVIVRIDISALRATVPEAEWSSKYLHVCQEKNNALLVAVGMDATGEKGSQDTDKTKKERDMWGNVSFTNLVAAQGSSGTQYNRKTASYKLSDLCDSGANDIDKSTPYLDVILFSSASIVAGADATKEGSLNGDVELNFYIDDIPDYDRETNWEVNSPNTSLADKCFKKFYDEAKAKEANADIWRYKVKGSDLQLETMVDNSDKGVGGDDTKTTYWSFEKALEHDYYNLSEDTSKDDPGCGRTVKLMIEVPVVSDLALKGTSTTTEGTSTVALKKRTLDVNSFDIQIANNKSPDAGKTYNAGLYLENAWLKIMDSNETTGAELAIGNNAIMTIADGGKLIIDKTCQLEMEWDGATTQPAAEGQTAPASETLNNGALDLLKGGEVENNGVVTIEGTEGKPYQPGQSGSTQDQTKGHGELTIREGATFTNNGCLMPNGSLYVLGNLVNNGKFDVDPLVSNDPDRGQFTYHRGIQCTWKDDVTQANVVYGGMYVGMDKDWKEYKNAVVTNNGDILICPGELINLAKINIGANGGIYLCATDRAIIPIEPDPATPTITTKEVDLDNPVASKLMNWGTIDNQGEIRPGQVTVTANGTLNKLIVPGNYDDMFDLTCWEEGKITGTGYVYKHNLKNATVSFFRDGEVIESAPYDGSAQTLGMSADFGDDIVCGTNDYKLTYLDSTGAEITADKMKDAGTYKLQLKGQNAFTGTVTKEFTITPASLTELVLNETSFKYDDTVHMATAKSVKAGELTLAETDYTLSYSAENPKDVGTYTATATGKGNFTGEAKATYDITKNAVSWKRLAGSDRYQTMSAIVKEGFTTSEYAVIATGANFPDALAASALAGAYGCPVVLTDSATLSKDANATLKSLGVKQAFIMGGDAAVSKDVEKALKDMKIEVTRIAGNSRQDTSVKALEQVQKKAGSVKTVIVATGFNYPDTLSISPWSYANAAPIVLTEQDGTLSDATLAAVKKAGATSAVIVGGTGPVSSKVESQLKSAGATTVTRLAGTDRYQTSAEVAKYAVAHGMNYLSPAVATGVNFPDALAGAAFVGNKGSVLLLAADQNSSTVALLTANKDKLSKGYLLGGEGAVSKDLADYLAKATK